MGKKNAPVLNSKTFQRVTCNGLWKKSAKPAHSFMIWCVISSDFVARLKMLIIHLWAFFPTNSIRRKREGEKSHCLHFCGKKNIMFPFEKKACCLVSNANSIRRCNLTNLHHAVQR